MKPVLYIEDEPDDAFFLSYAWEQAGVSNPLITIPDGQQAIDYLAGHGRYGDRHEYPIPCLLLLDLKLPLKSGFEVLRWIRQQPALEGLDVVILSGSDQDRDVELARSLGVTDYIVKPATPTRLAEILRERKSLWFTDA